MGEQTFECISPYPQKNCYILESAHSNGEYWDSNVTMGMILSIHYGRELVVAHDDYRAVQHVSREMFNSHVVPMISVVLLQK